MAYTRQKYVTVLKSHDKVKEFKEKKQNKTYHMMKSKGKKFWQVDFGIKRIPHEKDSRNKEGKSMEV